MLVIETKRLKIIPLDLRQLKISLNDRASLAKEISIGICSNKLDEIMKRVYKVSIKRIKEDPNNYLFYTNWIIVDKEKNHEVGSMGIKGIPNEKEEIEIGYGIEEEFQGNGYMTEALQGLVNWAFGQTKHKIKFVIACTVDYNKASQNVLIKNGFEIYNEEANHIWWRKG
ncbi:GNAT family N-acetyltransferase [Sporosalibacterium faouarense]|uniref:GNAT family N-acetyltransferase n=1 Tax=Sporosalibacterium faouarense TaxID=516123 RepID=UPI00141D21F0|nr:GNAT family N-acetyltransferase [Sporosalibacterium faouarense]MTI48406.1 GNAT family N-acetyltransferase [Bacillota bacterium]